MILTPDQLPIEEYHAAVPRWWSKTSLRNFQAMGPKWTRMAYIDKSISQPRPDGALQGLALDCYLTEGIMAFAKRFPILPDDAPKRPSKTQINAKNPSPDTVSAIQWWSDWDAAHPGAEYLNTQDRAILADAVDAVRHCCEWAEIEKAMAQHTVRRDQPSLGIGLQARPDWMSPTAGRVWDLKKTRDLERFGAQAIDLAYHTQAAIAGWCLAGDGIQIDRSFLVAVEWERGARCRVFEIPHDVLVYANEQMRKTAEEVARRINERDWADRQDAPEALQVPAYLMRKMEAA